MSGVPHRGDRVRQVDAAARARPRRGPLALLRARTLARRNQPAHALAAPARARGGGDRRAPHVPRGAAARRVRADREGARAAADHRRHARLRQKTWLGDDVRRAPDLRGRRRAPRLDAPSSARQAASPRAASAATVRCAEQERADEREVSAPCVHASSRRRSTSSSRPPPRHLHARGRRRRRGPVRARARSEPPRGAHAALYCYRAADRSQFIAEREATLERLPGYAEASKLLEGFDGLDRYLASVGGEAARARRPAPARARRSWRCSTTCSTSRPTSSCAPSASAPRSSASSSATLASAGEVDARGDAARRRALLDRAAADERACDRACVRRCTSCPTRSPRSPTPTRPTRSS